MILGLESESGFLSARVGVCSPKFPNPGVGAGVRVPQKTKDSTFLVFSHLYFESNTARTVTRQNASTCVDLSPKSIMLAGPKPVR